MTVGNTAARVRYAGDGATTAFPVPFAFIDAADLAVVERTIADGAERLLVLAADYTVSGGGGAAGTVTAGAAPSAAVEWIIRRATARTQDTDYTANDPFPAETHERALDRLTMIAQEQDEALGRVPSLPVSSALSSLVLPEPAAGQLLAWNAGADGIANVAAADADLAVVTTYAQSLLDDSDAAAARATLGLGSAAVIDAAAGGSAGLLRADGDGSALTGIAAVEPTGGNVLTPHEGLVVKQATTETVDIDARALLLKTGAGTAIRVEDVDLTVDMTMSGTNGLDTGVEAVSTWYHVWVISDGSTVAGLLSTSATIPTLPGGYVYRGYAGAVYNDAGGDFVAFFQRGEKVTQVEQAALLDGTETTLTPVSLTAHVPAFATSVFLRLQIEASSGTAITTLIVQADEFYGQIRANTVGSPNVTIQTNAELLLTTAQQLKYRVTGVNAIGDILTEGWRF